MFRRLAVLTLIGVGGVAHAAEGVIADPAATAACSKASGLTSPAVSAPIRFSDAMNRSAMVLSGARPGAKSTAKSATKLCLYDRHSGRAETQDMTAWSVPPRR